MKKYRPFLVTVFAVIILTFAACSNDSDSPQTDPFESQLRTLPNVVSVEKITKKTDYKGSIYTVYFNSLLDPSDASKGKFKQKAYIGFTGYEKPVCLTTAGYMLSEQIVTRETPENECAFILNGNLIAVEHRYFGESVRTDKKRSDGNYDGSYWEYLSTKNAADDLHAIITSLKRLLKGKWLAQGSSKGGLTSNLLCYYHPEDLDLTIPYVAPLCNGKYDSRLFDFICDTAGNEDDRYKDKAAELRKLFNDNSNLGEGTKSKSDWIKTTDEKIIMIYGNSDPWYAVRINDVARDNVHIFVHPSNNHMSAITLFPEAQRNQILNLLVEYLLK